MIVICARCGHHFTITELEYDNIRKLQEAVQNYSFIGFDNLLCDRCCDPAQILESTCTLCGALNTDATESGFCAPCEDQMKIEARQFLHDTYAGHSTHPWIP